tara:strand:+ start:194 stop:1063 length:870 start_codon:yes stop_codon:yes gene_type:complete
MGRRKRKTRIKVTDIISDPERLAEEVERAKLGRTLSLLRGTLKDAGLDFQEIRQELTQPPIESRERIARYLSEEAISELIRRKLRVDHREYWLMLDYIAEAGFEIVHLNTGEGDYASDKVSIERKDKDWWSSLFGDGRVMKQLSTMREDAEFSFLIVSRSWTQLKRELSAKNVSPEVMVGFVASLSVIGYPPIFCDDNHDASRLIERIVHKVEDDHARVFIERPKKATPAEYRNAIIESLPKIGVKLRRRITDRWPTLAELSTASVEDLESVEGIGKKTAERIREIFNG